MAEAARRGFIDAMVERIDPIFLRVAWLIDNPSRLRIRSPSAADEVHRL
jgi:hypothetical protein